MRDIERLSQAVQTLVNGWRERVEYRVSINGNLEDRVKTVRHQALLAQLHAAAGYSSSGSGNGGGSTNKPESRPPGNMAPLNLIEVITEEARKNYDDLCTVVNGKPPTLVRHRPVTQTLHDLVAVAMNGEDYPVTVRYAAYNAGIWVRRARILLGYEKRQVMLRDVVCGRCGGALAVATDASTDVRCIGSPAAPSCGQIYPRHEWINLLPKGE